MTRRTTASLVILLLTGGAVACSAEPPPDGLSPEQSAYITEVAGLDGRLSAEPEVALTLGARLCEDLRAGQPRAEVVVDAQRFTGGESFLEIDKAAAVLDAAVRHLCPGAG